MFTKMHFRGTKANEHGGLPDSVIMAIGMKVMVTMNVETDLYIANGARGEILKIVLDEREPHFDSKEPIIHLSYPPAYILVKMETNKIPKLQGLEASVVPLVTSKKSFTIAFGNEKKTVKRNQFPLTPAYAFTDYRSQGQTISHAIIDIATPPSGSITAFNVYVALSRCRGRDNIRLLRDFDEKLLMSHPSEYLRLEDQRLHKLDRETKKWWDIFQKTRR
jgi:ATP-dependent exoDNAse (exonuclease V) alpha subunit